MQYFNILNVINCETINDNHQKLRNGALLN